MIAASCFGDSISVRCKVTSDLWPLYARIAEDSAPETAAEGEYPIAT